jgi:uncharacterized protein YecT (DUF1311 family)
VIVPAFEHSLPIRMCLWIGAIILSIATAHAEDMQPSFDCAKARSVSERAICSDGDLAQLDRELSSVYERALAAAAVEKTSQLAWIKRRDAACLSREPKNCLRTQMQERIADLQRAILHKDGTSVEQPQPAPSEPTNVNGLLRPSGSGGVLPNPNSGLKVLDHHLLFAAFDPSGKGQQIISVDPATGKSAVVAAQLQNPTAILFSDRHATVVLESHSQDEGGNELVVSGTAGLEWRRFNTGSTPDTATIIDQKLYVATASKEFPPRLRLDVFDLFAGSQIASREIWNVPDHGLPVFWNGKIILVAPGSVTLYDERLDKIVSSPAPADEGYGSSGCGVVRPQVFDARLIYQISCGHIAIFDLGHFVFDHEFERFDPSAFVSLDVAGNLLFAVPTDSERRPNNGAVFDLSSGKRVAVLPLTADAIAVSGDVLMALAPKNPDAPNAVRPIFLYRVQQDELTAAAQQRALEQAHARGLAVMARSGSFDDAVDAIESAATDRLFDVNDVDQQLRVVAIDYASWLAGTFDRRTAGIKLLDRLAAAGPNDTGARRRLGAALFRDYLLTGAPVSLDRAQHLLSDEPDLSALRLPSTPTARSAPIEFAYFGDHIAFWRDKIVIGHSPGSNKPPSVAVYDRTTLKLLWSRDIPASENRANITGITFEGDRIMAWLLPNNSDRGRVAIIDVLSHNLILRPMPTAFGTVLQTANGVAGCEGEMWSSCTIVDSKTFKATAHFECDAMGLAYRGSADDEALAKLVGAGCQIDGRGQLVALGKRWMLMANGTWPGPYPLSYRRVADAAGWQNSGLHLLARGASGAKISDARDTAIVDNRQPDLHRFSSLDFKTGAYRTIFQVPDPKDAGVAWTIADSLLIVGAGHNLILYDIADHRMAGVLHDVIGEEVKGDGSAIDHARIVKLLVDGPRLIVSSLDGQYSRVLQMSDVVNYAKTAAQNFKLVDAMLGN